MILKDKFLESVNRVFNGQYSLSVENPADQQNVTEYNYGGFTIVNSPSELFFNASKSFGVITLDGYKVEFSIKQDFESIFKQQNIDNMKDETKGHIIRIIQAINDAWDEYMTI